NYLKAQTPDPWITQALVATGETNYSVDHLKTVNGSLATDYAKTILAVAAAGQNPATFGNIDYVVKLKTYFNSNQFGDTSLLNDDAWAILALAAVGEKNSTEVIAAKNYLLANQNADGGWGYGTGGASDTNDTAAIIIALLEAGVNSSDASITKAVNYLKNLQNSDGGFGWQAGSGSDSGSDAWIIAAINKLGQNPADWQKDGKNPADHLWSLQDSDGGFWWVAPGTSDFNNKAMTAYAVIALAGKSFPVGYYANGTGSAGDNHVRIEGKNNTICDTYVTADTALAVIEKAAAKCNFTFTIENTSYGLYLKQVGDDAAAGASGWLYLVNFVAPAVGAADYQLKTGDEVLWYFGDWGWQPTKISVSKNYLSSGEKLIINVKYFNGQDWLALENAKIIGCSQEPTTNNSGQAEINLPDGVYSLFAEKNNYVRSNKETVSVGSGLSQNVNLSVEITQGLSVAGEAIIFSVSPNKLDFGKMKPGEAKSSSINLANQGTINLAVKATVSGDDLFTGNTKINDQGVSVFTKDLATNEIFAATTTLTIPAGYLGSGVKNGELIFWAQAK
ncbi:MAG: DUF4430 domain-containing protein, partial [Candidatus Falkowbacteria bacterium]|nr:DUF4430 domain-containing protein [Candidatus Falkowbacteria bacterium]